MKQRISSLFLALIMIMSFMPVLPASAEESGTCGNNLTWVLDDGGTLTISGTGVIDSGAPWADYRENIYYIVIEYGVTSIGGSAFEGYSSLTSVTIPDSVTSIGDRAFSWCSSLTSINVSEKNTNYCSIDGNLFDKNKSNLIQYAPGKADTEYIIPDSVTSIGGSAFEDCHSLTSIAIPNSVTSIGGFAFGHCSSLTSVIIPDSVTSIGGYAFYCCRSLTSVTIPDSVTSIGGSAFEDCSSLTSVTIPDSVTSIGDRAFSWCSSLTSINVSEKNTNYCSIDGNLFDKNKSNLIQYAPGKADTEYIIPDSVTSIGDRAFACCSSLTSVTIPDSVTSIGGYAFACCSSLTSVTIPDSVTSIGSLAFEYCSSLTSITIPNSVTIIGSSAFYGCDNLIVSVSQNSYAYDYVISNNIRFIVRTIDDFTFKSKTKDTASFSYTNPVGHESIDLYQLIDGIWTNIDAVFSDGSVTVSDLAPATTYYFKLLIAGGEDAGESNIVSVYIDSDKCELLNKDEISYIITKELSYTIMPQISEKATYQIYDGNAELLESNTLSLTYGDNKLTIKVTAENGEYADYPITIYAQSNKCELLNKAEISNIVTKELSYTITPQISEKATYEIYDGNAEVLESNTLPLEYGDNQFTIKVTAENGDYAEYPITIYAQSEKCELLNKEDISNIVTKELSYTIEPQISEKATYQIYDGNAELLESNTLSLEYGDNQFTIKVTAENGDYAEYPITIYAQSEKCELLNKEDISNIVTKELSYTIEPQISEKATYQIYDGNAELLESNTFSLTYGDNKFTIKVTAENGEYANYPITIYVQSNKCELLNKDEISNITTKGTSYTIEPRISEKATYQIYDSNSELLESNTLPLEYGDNKFTIKVIAENGEYEKYPIVIYAQSNKCELLNKAEISNIVIKELSYTIEPQVSEKATYQIYDNNSKLLESDTLPLEHGENKFTIKVTAESGEYAEYPITIYVQSNKCELLNKAEISNITTKGTSYTIEPRISEKATYQIYDSNAELLESNTLSLVYGENKFTLKVTAETGDYAEYPIVIYVQSNKCELLNSNEISNIVTKELSYTIEPQISEKATYQIYDSNAELLESDTLPLEYGDNNFTIKVTAENGEYAEYLIKIYVHSNKCELLNESELSCEVSNTCTEYEIKPQISDKAAYELYNSDNEKLESDTVSLNVGKNIFKIKVTAENQIDSKDYTITIKRREKLPDVVSSHESGYYVFDNRTITLSLTNDNPSAKIYYTTDGTIPTTESTLYESGIELGDAVTVKAVAVCDGYDDSDVLTIELNRAVAPTNLKIQSISSTSAELVYNVPDGVTKYRLYGSKNRGQDWILALESSNANGYIYVTGLYPETEYMFKIEALYSDNTPLESNAILGRTTVYISSECDILRTWSPYDALVDNDNNTITGARVMNSYNKLTLDIDVSSKASWYVYPTLDDARFSRNEITDKTMSLDNEGGDNYAYIKVVAEDEVHSNIYKIIVYRQSKSAMPSVSVKNNYILKDTEVALSADGEIIKYTTDGTDPSEINGTIYTNPIVISSDTILKISSKESGKDEYSDVLTQIYYVVDDIPTEKLSKPINLTWTNKAAVWDAVENADGYIVQLYKNNNTHGNAVEAADNFLNFSNYITETGAYSFTVTAKGDGVYYEDSDVSAMSGMYNYTAPKHDKIVIADNQIQLNDISDECTVIVSAYNNQCMLGCRITNISNDTVIDLNSLNLDLDNADRISVFLWADIGSMEPITSKVQYPLK